ncbi:MAG: branched-chain amino acid ABC transporter permease [Thermodesulfobacteriota bacterium]
MKLAGKWITLGVIGAVLCLLPVVVKSEYYVNLLFLLLFHSALAQSWNILGGYAGQVSIGHAAFFGAGAFVTRLLWVQGLPLPLALIIAGLVAVILASIIGIPALRLRGPYFAMGTMALAEALYLTLRNLLPGVAFLPGRLIAAYSLPPRYYLALFLVAAIFLCSYLVMNSKAGLAIEAIRNDQDAAEATGVNLFRYKVFSLTLSAFFMGLTGGAFAYYHASYYIAYPFSMGWSFEPLVMTIIGGSGTLMGPIIGAVFFVGLREVLAVQLAQMHIILFGAVFVLVVIFLPGGIVEGWRRILRTFFKVR